MNISPQTKIKDIISHNRLLEGVLYRLGIKKPIDDSVEEVSQNTNQNPDFVTAILKAFDENSSFPKKELAAFPLSSLLEYLRRTHEFYLSKKLPEIEQSLINLNNHSNHQLILSLHKFFLKYKSELAKHIHDEEEYFFPYIEYLVKLKQHGTHLINPIEKIKNYSIHTFTLVHDEVEKNLIEIKSRIVNYYPALSTVLPYRIFLIQLESLEKDLQRHALVEDEVLVPKALWLERSIFNTSSN